MTRLKAMSKRPSQQLITENDPTRKVQSYLMSLDHLHPDFTDDVIANITHNRREKKKKKDASASLSTL